MTKNRNSNIELLRIISIVMIVVSHYCVHGAASEKTATLNLGINRFILEFLTLGNLGTILFVLISGYYLINSNNVKLKKLFRLFFQIMFYSIIIYCILLVLNIETFKLNNLVKSVFPITFKMYWFATVYIILYTFHPFINKLLNNFSRKEHLSFIVLMFLIFSIFGTITKSDYYGNELIQFLMFYSIGAYLFKYPNNILVNNNNNIKIMILSILLIALSIICLDILGEYNPSFGSNSIYLLNRTSPLAIMFCVSLFNFFTSKKIFNNQFINRISILIFGVYLISDNKFIRPILWQNLFNNNRFINSPYLIIHIIYSVGTIIIFCLLIEFIRKELFEKNIFNILDKKIDLLQSKIKNKIDKKLNWNN